MFNSRLFVITALSMALSACQNQESPQDGSTAEKITASNPIIAQDDVIATLNNRKINNKEFAVYKKFFSNKEADSTANDQELLQQLIDIELWAQEARNKSLDQDIEKILRAQLLTKQFYAEQAKEHLLLTKPLTKEQIKAEYEKRYGQKNLQQVKIHIIELSSQEKIDQILNSLKMGADFKELARLAQNTDSMDQETPWVTLNSLEPEQIRVLSQIEDGQFTQEAIKTESGWQLMLLESSRVAPAPPFNDVRKELVDALQQQQLALHTRVLRDAMDIRIAGENTQRQQEEQPKDEFINTAPSTTAIDTGETSSGSENISPNPAPTTPQTE